MFTEYYVKADRGRVFVPPKFRHHFVNGLELSLDTENRFIAVYPCQEPELRLDARGRFVVPKHLRDRVGIKNVAVVVGSDDFIEIWSESSWEEEKRQAQQQS